MNRRIDHHGRLVSRRLLCSQTGGGNNPSEREVNSTITYSFHILEVYHVEGGMSSEDAPGRTTLSPGLIE